MRSKAILCALAALVLAGCSTTAEERRVFDEQTCRGYGFTPGSDAFANCLLQLDLDRREARRAQLRSAPPLFMPRYIFVGREDDD